MGRITHHFENMLYIHSKNKYSKDNAASRYIFSHTCIEIFFKIMMGLLFNRVESIKQDTPAPISLSEGFLLCICRWCYRYKKIYINGLRSFEWKLR